MRNGKGRKSGYTSFTDEVTDIVRNYVQDMKKGSEDLLITNKKRKGLQVWVLLEPHLKEIL